jgi:hypothetical protein
MACVLLALTACGGDGDEPRVDAVWRGVTGAADSTQFAGASSSASSVSRSASSDGMR